jgi:hypothetical protein
LVSNQWNSDQFFLSEGYMSFDKISTFPHQNIV